jgi:NAD(P)-dependent dehydrogenase (short-subunit alcohol dehydrogenase family)
MVMSQQTILITGATAGIGKAAALTLARQGATVFASGRRQEALDELRDTANIPTLIPLHLDVTDYDSIERAAAEVQQQTNGRGVDVIINNAGYGIFGPSAVISDEALRHLFDVNVFGLMQVTRTFAPPMIARGDGRIINIASVAGRVVFPFGGAYNASKFAVEALSDALRMELALFGVKVILIEPGAIRTGFTDAAYRVSNEFRPPDSPYAVYMDNFEQVFEQSYTTAPGPEVVVDAIVKAITSPRPKARYTLPFRERMMVFLFQHVLPTWAVDGLIVWLLKRMATQQAAQPPQPTHQGQARL